MTRGESSPFMTSSPRKTKLPPPRHPLENRNSAPDIVVTGTTGLTQFRHSSLGNCPTSGPAINPTGSRRQQHPLEDRIHRAKARVQNGLYNLSSTSQSSSASSIYSTNRYLNFKLPYNIQGRKWRVGRRGNCPPIFCLKLDSNFYTRYPQT